MSGRSFRSVFMVASCAGAALGCYLVSLNVASERAALEEVETKIVLAQRDIRLLQTEIGTRGRLAQLERWNVKVLALSAPSADQFVDGGFELARMITPDKKPVLEAPVVLASATQEARPQIARAAPAADEPDRAVSSGELLHQASLKTSSRRSLARSELAAETDKSKPAANPAAKPTTKSERARTAAPVTKPALKKSVDKAASEPGKPVTKAKALAKKDPLAPLPDNAAKPKKIASSTTKDPARKQ